MVKLEFNELLLQTVFCCMASDGDIHQTEVDLIKSLEEKEKLFKVENIEKELNSLVQDINKNGHVFLRKYLYHLKQMTLSEDEEIEVVRTAVKTIKVDNDEKYSEIKWISFKTWGVAHFRRIIW